MKPRTLRRAVVVAGAALVVRRALRRRVKESPLWPLPALEEPVSGRPRARALKLLVTGHERIADGVVQLRLEGHQLPAWQPGAHLDLVLPSGLVRQYSLCGDPEDSSSYTVATRLVPAGEGGRGGSREVHEQLAEGAEVEVRGPRNRFPLDPAAPAYLFVAGGIGITPVLPMLRAAEARGADWKLLYGGRTRASMPFLEDVRKLAGDRVTVVAEDEDGRPDLGAALADTAPGTAVYCCGPEGLMAAVEEALPEGRTLHLERFAPRGPSDGDRPFEVELRRSGKVVPVPGGTTVLAAVRAELPSVMYSCEQGFCGTCQQRVLEGEIDHRDELLTDAERADSMLICVSRARGDRLTLDL
ncbi:PDR/VanB family oxidoreductase [Streptomyces longispororuber]|uniref:PDR/VanB family oxidoreductase n=1 Tax=Streptomyces longispororuber TaxID=68230 RepID=UPI002108A05A|nr:PDR/VanB family oxidoreductase [Streptomyces longispororuber]MCQ4207114.1 PDR/VanB family oxidoreductase [Streptomyces longispororuber]